MLPLVGEEPPDLMYESVKESTNSKLYRHCSSLGVCLASPLLHIKNCLSGHRNPREEEQIDAVTLGQLCRNHLMETAVMLKSYL